MGIEIGRHTWATRSTVVVLVALALLQLWLADRAQDDDLSIERMLFPITLIAVLVLARANCFESRLAVVLACSGQMVVAGLALLVGLPGQQRVSPDPASVAALLLPLAAVALVGLDWEVRHLWRGPHGPFADRAPGAVRADRSPYAR